MSATGLNQTRYGVTDFTELAWGQLGAGQKISAS
jgi:hypothetical protein